MKVSNNLFDLLKNSLSAAYRAKGDAVDPADSRWEQNVMRSVRQIGPIHYDVKNRSGFTNIAWRLTPVALALMVMLAVLIIRVNDTLELQATGLMVSDPVQTYVTYDQL